MSLNHGEKLDRLNIGQTGRQNEHVRIILRSGSKATSLWSSFVLFCFFKKNEYKAIKVKVTKVTAV